MPHLAGVIAASYINGKWHLTIDGEEFPWELADGVQAGPMSVHGYPMLTVSIMASQVEIVHAVPTPAPTSVKPGVYDQDDRR